MTLLMRAVIEQVHIARAHIPSVLEITVTEQLCIVTGS